MSTDKLSRRYAQALFDEAISTNSLASVYNEVLSVDGLLNNSRELKAFFSNPIIKSDKKKAVVKELFSKDSSSKIRDYILFLIDKGRESYLSDILDMFQYLYNKYNNITKVNITTAVEMDAAVEKQIKELITKKTGKENFIINTTINPAILGGFIVHIDDKIIDASVATRINKISKELIYN